LKDYKSYQKGILSQAWEARFGGLRARNLLSPAGLTLASFMI